MIKPPATSDAFAARMTMFFNGFKSGNNALALKGFLPVSAYVVLKQGHGNAADWQYRLVDKDFIPQLNILRKRFGKDLPTATYVTTIVPEKSANVCPVGQEENKAPYWRVYMSRVVFQLDGKDRSFLINTMISFRGEWYIVHLIGYG